VVVEVLVFGRDDRVAQVWRNLIVRDDKAALGRKLSKRLAILVAFAVQVLIST